VTGSPLRFLADENFPTSSIALLRQQQFDVKAIVEIYPAYVDRNVLSLAVDEQRVLLTFDRDFGELVFVRGHPPPPAIVYFRFELQSPTEPANILLNLLNAAKWDLIGMMTVVSRGPIRQRPFPTSDS
jgi:predicted nuclease of predicted toxin-antitoxin system